MTVPGPSERWTAGDVLGRAGIAGRMLQVIPEPRVVAQECFDLAAKPLIGPAPAVEVGRACFGRRDLLGIEEDALGRLILDVDAVFHVLILVSASTRPKGSATVQPDSRQESGENSDVPVSGSPSAHPG